ncbi:MAG TPA: hypothetical protein VF069_00775 [Streptosporangiaceae bacterium]
MGVTEFEGAGFERLLADTRRALGALSSAGAQSGPGDHASDHASDHAGDRSRDHAGDRPGDDRAGAPAEPLRGEGSAADGKITATVAAGGRLDELIVDPRLLRAGADELCAQIKIAVNAAVDDLRANTARAGAGAAVMDPAELAAMVTDLQTESVRQMSQFAQGIAETVAKISAAAGGDRRG